MNMTFPIRFYIDVKIKTEKTKMRVKTKIKTEKKTCISKENYRKRNIIIEEIIIYCSIIIIF